MVSKNSSFEKTKRNNSVEKYADNSGFETDDLSWLTHKLPVTVFKASGKLSWGIEYLSPNVDKLTGYSREDFIDQKLSWSDIVFPEDATIVDKAVKEAKINKSPYQVEYRIKKSDGTTVFIQEQAHPGFDDNGKLAYIAGIFLDQTSVIKQRENSNDFIKESIKEDEKVQLEMFRSFVEKISTGEEIEQINGNFAGETKRTMDLINQSIGNIMGVIGEIQTISKAGKEGRLSTRASDSKYPGEWGLLLRELNGALDSIINPLNTAVEYVERISRGDIPESITDDYKGDFNEIKNNLNKCIASINNLIGDALTLSETSAEGILDIRADTSRHEGDFRKIVEYINRSLDSVISPLNVTAEYVERISRGDIPQPITDNYKGDFNEIKNNLNVCINAINNLIEDSIMLSEAGVSGNLDVRADNTRHRGDFRTIIEGINATLDTVVGPLNVAAEYVERISRGDIPDPITDDFNGDFNEIKNNLNTCIDGLQGLIECNDVLHCMAINDHSKSVEGEYLGIFASMGNATNEVRERLLSVTKLMNEIAVGDTCNLEEFKKIGKRSEQDHLLPAIIQAMENIELLLEDTKVLSRSAVEGKLDIRADVTKHRGEYKKVVEGINDTLDAVIVPLNVAAEYVERISRGDIPEPIKENYNGDFNEIKNNLNICIEAVNNLIEDSLMLSEAGVAGRLDTRADATRHEGDFRKIVEGFNNTLDSIIGPLNVAAEYVERISRGDVPGHIIENYNGDFNEIKNNLNVCIDAINNLVEDTLMLAEAGVAGQLDTRADATRHEGNFQWIINGMNGTLDAVIGPLNVAAEYVERISRGDIPEHITDDYEGDFNEIKNNLNVCIDGLQGLVECNNILKSLAKNDHIKGVEGEYLGIFASMGEATNEVRDRLLSVTKLMNEIAVGDTSQLEEFKKIGKRSEQDHLLPAMIQAMENIEFLLEDIGTLTKAALAGELDSRIEESKHKGEYKRAVQGINDTLDAVICPLNSAAGLIERISLGDIPDTITDECFGDFRAITNNLNACIEAINNLIEDSLMLSTAGTEGRLDTRADVTRHQGDFRRIVEGVNNTLDAVIGPLNVAAEYVERISRGDIPKPITDNYNGDFNEIKNNLNTCIFAINSLVEDSLILSEAAVAGRLKTRADASKHEGDFRKIVAGVNDTLDAVIGPLNVAAEYVERIGRGEIPEPITKNYNGDFNELKNNINNCIDGLQGLVECNNILQRMAVNDQTKGVEGQYIGIYASMAEATNLVRARVLNVTKQLNNIAVGDSSELENLKKIGKRSEQDQLLPAIIRAMGNVKLLIEDTEMLVEAAVEGKLDTRADASRHQGEYRKIVQGVNDTLDAVIGPLNVAAEYVERISRGDIPELITENYNGDFNEIKNNLNRCIVAVNNLVDDTDMLAKAGIAGQLETRAEAGKHQGDFRKIVEGVNDTLDAVIGPLNEAIRVANEFSDGNFKVRFDKRLNVEGDFVNFRDGLNNIGVSVSEIIKSAQSVTSQVAEHSDEASKGAAEVATAAGNVAMSSQKSSELTRELLYKIEGINREIIDLSESNEKIAVSSKGILSAANEVVRIGKDAQALGRDTNLKMESVEKIARESVVGITSLTEQIKQIDGIVQLINDITSQINLLSLNAAIEAARAGEHGRGFAVVAGEVKNLATKARNATDTIETVVNSVQRDSKKTADAINLANNEIIDGVNSVNKTLDALNTIIKNATQVTTDIGDITKAIEGQVNISMKVVKASEEGNVMTQEVQREAEGLAATAQETSASVQEIGAAIHEVTALSVKLKAEMEEYKV